MNGYGEDLLDLSEGYGEEEEYESFGEFGDEAEFFPRARARPRVTVATRPYARPVPAPRAPVSAPQVHRGFENVRQDVRKLGTAIGTVQRQSTGLLAQTRRELNQLRETGQNAAFITAAVSLLLADRKPQDVWRVVVPPLVPAVMSLLTEAGVSGRATQARGPQTVFGGNLIPMAILGVVIWQKTQQQG